MLILLQIGGSSIKSLRILQEMVVRREEELFHGRILLQLCTWLPWIGKFVIKMLVLTFLQNLGLKLSVYLRKHDRICLWDVCLQPPIKTTNLSVPEVLFYIFTEEYTQEIKILVGEKPYPTNNKNVAFILLSYCYEQFDIWVYGLYVWKTHGSRAFKKIKSCFYFLVQMWLTGISPRVSSMALTFIQ